MRATFTSSCKSAFFQRSLPGQRFSFFSTLYQSLFLPVTLPACPRTMRVGFFLYFVLIFHYVLTEHVYVGQPPHSHCVEFGNPRFCISIGYLIIYFSLGSVSGNLWYFFRFSLVMRSEKLSQSYKICLSTHAQRHFRAGQIQLSSWKTTFSGSSHRSIPSRL